MGSWLRALYRSTVDWQVWLRRLLPQSERATREPLIGPRRVIIGIGSLHEPKVVSDRLCSDDDFGCELGKGLADGPPINERKHRQRRSQHHKHPTCNPSLLCPRCSHRHTLPMKTRARIVVARAPSRKRSSVLLRANHGLDRVLRLAKRILVESAKILPHHPNAQKLNAGEHSNGERDEGKARHG